MAHSSASPSSISKRRRGSQRSVAGCLTCRRRRVKCTSQELPCDNCHRLKLSCIPSFHVNFKNWTPDTTCSSQSYPASTRDPKARPSVESREKGEDMPQDILHWLSDGLDNEHFDPSITYESANLGDVGRVAASQFPTSQEQVRWSVQSTSNSLERNFLRLGTSDIMALSNSFRDESAYKVVTPTTIIQPTQSESTSVTNTTSPDNGFEELGFFDFDTVSLDSSMWTISPQVSQIYGNSHGTMPFLDNYESSMPALLTSKTSPWNPYNYMLNSARLNPDSPLRQGILCWTCSYIACQEQNAAYSGSIYYVAASTSVSALISELSTSQKSLAVMRKDLQASERLYMLLSTTFFLSHCDLMLCDYKSLHDRLESIKSLFENRWQELRPKLGSLERRLLIWLAYLDLRSSLFGGWSAKPAAEGKQRNLLNVLVKLDAFRSLRSLKPGRSYLSDCFGDNYPKKEVEEDLMQEPCHRKCDDILAILSNINDFEDWNDEFYEHGHGDIMVQELRDAKIQALQGNISRVRAVSLSTYFRFLDSLGRCRTALTISQECMIIFRGSSSKTKDTIERTTFHALTVTALHLSATIMLNRIVNPNVRTDSESQSASRELVQISYRLRKTKYLRAPRSLIWPLPIFIAGIEITDEIYQEWIISYMKELEQWGPHIKKTRELLERIIRRQERERRRVRVRDAMEDFGATIIV